MDISLAEGGLNFYGDPIRLASLVIDDTHVDLREILPRIDQLRERKAVGDIVTFINGSYIDGGEDSVVGSTEKVSFVLCSLS